MKTILFPTLATVTGVALNLSTLAADPPPVPLAPPAAEIAVPARPAAPALPALPALPDIGPMLSDLQRQLHRHLSQVGSAVQDIVTAVPGGGGSFGGGGDFFVRQAGQVRPGRTIVVPGKAMDSKTTANAEEDLNVMARILEKALVSREEDKEERRAMGIAISMFGPGSGAPRNLYLDGYGAVFFFDVNYPLLPPPRKEDEPKSKEPVSSEWEEARREIEAAQSPDQRLHGVIKGSPRGGVAYDAERVEQLKDAILESLKNGAHIRNLQPEESITVVVTGGSSRGEAGKFKTVAPRVTRRSGDGRGTETTVEARSFSGDANRALGAGGETTMTIRVKKSDADAFAQEKLGMDEFRKRATVRVY